MRECRQLTANPRLISVKQYFIMHDFLSSNELNEMQDFEVLMRNNRSTMLEGKENPINKRNALIEYTVHH